MAYWCKPRTHSYGAAEHDPNARAFLTFIARNPNAVVEALTP